jgi:cytochrome c2
VAEEAVTEEAPAEEAVAEEAVTEEAPAEEAVAEEAVTEEAPAEESVAEEAVTEEAVTEEAPAAEMSAFEMMVAEGDVAAGARVWNQCRACHVADSTTNRVGPHIGDVVGRQSNSVEGFRYSGRLPDVVWTLDELDRYLESPRSYAPGTSMAFNGLRSQQDRANVLAYIQSLN